MKKRLVFIFTFILIFFVIGFFVFSPIYKLNSVYISYGLFPYDICQKQPTLWEGIKIIFIFSSLVNLLFISNFIYCKFFRYPTKKEISLVPQKINKNNLVNTILCDILTLRIK